MSVTGAFDFSDLPLHEAVFQAIGAASMCWDPRPGDQVFDSGRAAQIGEALLARIEKSVTGVLSPVP